MFYQNFTKNISLKYGVVIEDWPLDTFKSPSDISSRNEVTILFNAWKSGATRFRKLSAEELRQLEEDEFQAAMSQMGGGVDDEPTGSVTTMATTTAENGNPSSPTTELRSTASIASTSQTTLTDTISDRPRKKARADTNPFDNFVIMFVDNNDKSDDTDDADDDDEDDDADADVDVVTIVAGDKRV